MDTTTREAEADGGRATRPEAGGPGCRAGGTRARPPAALQALLLLLCAALPACGGGEAPAALAVVLFPPGVSATEASTLHVRGRSAGQPLQAVSVGGVAATSADGFLTWTATVPLVPGRNRIRVVATTTAGQPDPSAPELVVHRTVVLGRPESLDLDGLGARLLLLDAGLARVTLFDLTTGTLAVLSGTGRGTGTSFSSPQAAIFDLPRNRALVTDAALDAIFAVDLATGDRTFLTGQGAGSGTALSSPDGMALDLAGGRVLVVDSTLDAVIGVNLLTGARTVLSAVGTGGGTAFSLPTEIAHDVAGNRAFVRDPSVGALFAVDLATGNRSIVVDDMSGSFYDQFGGMALDLPNNRMLATDAGFDRVFATDLTTGVHTTISNGTGTGPELAGPASLVRDPVNGRVIVGQSGYERLLGVNLANGNRTSLSDLELGEGPRLVRPEAAAFDLGRGRILVADELGRRLVAVSYGDGERSVFVDGTQPGDEITRPTLLRSDAPRDRAFVFDQDGSELFDVDLDDRDLQVVSSGSVGTGSSLQFSSDLCYDVFAGRLLLVNGFNFNGIAAVDAQTGNRTVFASAAVGTGESVANAIAIECDASGSTVYYGTNVAGTIARIDVATGVRTKLSDDGGVGTGPSVAGMQALRLDPDQNRLIVLAGLGRAVRAVNLTTGNRVELSGPTVGQGAPIYSISGGDVDTDAQLAVLTDVTLTALVVVDLTNGERVLFSR